MEIRDLKELNEGQKIVVRIDTPLENLRFDLELMDSPNFEHFKAKKSYTPSIKKEWGEFGSETILEIPYSGHWYLVLNDRGYQNPNPNLAFGITLLGV
ncbi:MAG: DUF1883 domain-containing protein [Microscillaceae bacterium]|nr:DUF1883 domain-containing protein [Microscillaceae bacterium]